MSAMRVFLVGIKTPDIPEREAVESLAELAALAGNLGWSTVDRLVVRLRERPHPRFYVGSGKAEEIKTKAADAKAELIIFDEALSPSQQRNFEKLADCGVMDRHEVILNIFARRALTKEAKLQVELARLQYQLPRLRHSVSGLSQQRASAGSRSAMGAGETKLELDRRRIQDRIKRVKQALLAVSRQRSTTRAHRDRNGLPTAAVVGYTNAGKSSLLNALTGAQVLVEDKLFATLDPTTRRLRLSDGRALLVVDTVGFIRRLPHELVDAFKSTLEETTLADIIIQVHDASSPELVRHAAVTDNVLEELGAAGKPAIRVLNKIDLCPEAPPPLDSRASQELGVACSALTGAGLDGLEAALARALDRLGIPVPSAEEPEQKPALE